MDLRGVTLGRSIPVLQQQPETGVNAEVEAGGWMKNEDGVGQFCQPLNGRAHFGEVHVQHQPNFMSSWPSTSEDEAGY